MATKTTRSEKLDIRLTADAKTLLQQAAEVRHKSVSEFVLDSALGAAQDVLNERNVFMLDAGQWTTFLEALDAPPRRHPRLERLLSEPSVFD
ncbi:MAG: DUF1778 domain-containing protein [Alphaproteobacteria bacterium]|nr:DUF1778 domain-containing protein [Alphaproteobacteria bacterium]